MKKNRKWTKLTFYAILFLTFVFCGLIYSSSVLGVSAENTPRYYLTVGDFSYKKYELDPSGNTKLWYGAPNDQNAYVNEGNIVNPGTSYETALCFTAPTDGTIAPDWGMGTVFRVGQVTSTSDGVRFSVFLNNTKVYPQNTLWKDLPQGVDDNHDGNTDNPFQVSYERLSVKKGDKLYYIINNGGNANSDWDLTYLLMGFKWIDADNPNGAWFDSHACYWSTPASGEEVCPNLESYKKSELLSYHYVSIKEIEEKENVEMQNKSVRVLANDFTFDVYELDPSGNTSLWYGAPNDFNSYFTDGEIINPGDTYQTALTFTAPCDGTISNALGCGTIYRSGQVTATSDASRFCVVLNETILYPYQGVWAQVPQGYEHQLEISFNNVELKAGDTLYYIVDSGGNNNSEWDQHKIEMGFLWLDESNPDGVWVDARSNYWTSEMEGNELVSFGAYSKKDVFGYKYVSLNECKPVGAAVEYDYILNKEAKREELSYASGQEKYYLLLFSDVFVFENYCQPGYINALGMAWTAPDDGKVDISGSFVENYSYLETPDPYGYSSNGVRFKILINGTKQIYPTEGDWVLLNDSNLYKVEMAPFAVNAGDEVMFLLDCNEECNYDICRMNVVANFAKTGEEYTETYNSVWDFKPESKNNSAWKFYAVATESSSSNAGNNHVPVEVLKVKFSKGSCSGTIGGGSVLLILLSSAICLTLKKKDD